MVAETVDLRRLPLIASDLVSPTWLAWHGFALRMGWGPDIGKASDHGKLRLNSYTNTIQAVVSCEAWL